MATANVRGAERFEYTPSGGSPTTHLLAVPLQEIEAADPYPRREWWSADKRTRHVVTIGDGVRDIWATVRAEDQPGNLKTLLRSAIHDDITVTYRRTAGGTAYACKVVAVEGGDVMVRPDRDRKAMREWESRIHLRRVDGGTFDALLGS